MSTLFFYFPVLLLFSLMAVYAERKLAAFIQDRLGPMEVGYRGILQTLADLLKLLQKEAVVPAAADRILFLWAPVWMFMATLAAFSVLPVSSTWAGAGTSAGILYLFAFVSLQALGTVVAGWASCNKYAHLGAMRAAAQVVAYEVPLGLSILCVVTIGHTMDLQAISCQQSWGSAAYTPTDTLPIRGLWAWNVFRVPTLLLVYPIYFTAALAACHRAPFDLPETESELVGGFHTEYGGLRWAWMMLAEYSMMLLMSLVGVILFWGSWSTPFPDIEHWPMGTWTSGIPGSWSGHMWSVFWLFSKALLVVWVKLCIRWTWPRVRFDQLLQLCWQYLTPAALLLLFLTTLTAVWF